MVSLGEGPEGQKLRDALNAAAAATGKPLSAWARDVLLAEAGGTASDPIAEVLISRVDPETGERRQELTTVDLGSISAMQSGWAGQVQAYVFGGWTFLLTRHPEELIARWKRVKRGR